MRSPCSGIGRRGFCGSFLGGGHILGGGLRHSLVSLFLGLRSRAATAPASGFVRVGLAPVRFTRCLLSSRSALLGGLGLGLLAAAPGPLPRRFLGVLAGIRVVVSRVAGVKHVFRDRVLIIEAGSLGQALGRGVATAFIRRAGLVGGRIGGNLQALHPGSGLIARVVLI